MKSWAKKFLLFILISFAVGAAGYWTAEKAVISGWEHGDAWIVTLKDYRMIKDTTEAMEDDLPEWETVKYQLILSFHTGEFASETMPVTVEHLKDSRLLLSRGHKYILTVDRFDDGTEMFSVSDGFRFPIVTAFLAGLATLLCLWAGLPGARALAGLFLSLLILVKWTLPMILAGHPPLSVALASAAGVSSVTIVLVVRNYRYWPAAFAGAIGGAMAASAIGWTAVRLWGLAGVAAEGGNLLASTFPGINMQGILLASVIIGAIGAVLDVSVSITSAMAELHEYDPQVGAARLMKAGMNVGRDVLGSMINTLILAYFGSSLILSLLIANSLPVLWAVLNDPVISAELLRGIAGTAGLLLTVPVTSLAGSLWIVKIGGKQKPKD